ncbi:MAG: hypothetical protein LH615_09225 [Ferruginibacter sp.]|nr:hypothetical protein [Ferruginibacter sp.]
MKKIIFISGLIVIVVIISSFIFIPDTLVVSKVIYVESSDRIVYDYLLTNKNKTKWWPENLDQDLKSSDSTSFNYQKTNFKFFDAKFNSNQVIISKGDNVFSGTISSFFESKNSLKIVWRVSLKNNLNPIKRILNFYKATIIKKEITTLLEQFGNFVIKTENVYGLKIERTIVKDTLLLTTNKTLDHYPTINETYALVNNLEVFAKSNSAEITNSPMFNVVKTFEGTYNLTIALPVNKPIKEKYGYFVNKMFPGNILKVEIMGGKNRIENGFLQLKNYMNDFKLTSPAMPFEMIITNRNLERDTNKWVTELYYPIF